VYVIRISDDVGQTNRILIKIKTDLKL
jgi:hypothetical protein